jgi:hypothetical protein
MQIVDGWLDVAEQGETGWYNKSDPRSGDWWGIAIHGSSGLGTERWFNLPADQSSYASSHLVVEQDGKIWQGIPFTRGSWHAIKKPGYAPFLANVDPNNDLLSIEIVKPVGNLDPITAAQKQSVFALVAFLCSHFNIPAKLATDTTGGVVFHRQIDPPNRPNCPGTFPDAELDQFLKAQSQPQEGGDEMLELSDVAAFFTDGGNGTWKCKANGVTLKGDILTFYRKNNGLALLGLPLANENYSLAGAAFTICERGTIIYDPQRKYDNPPIAGTCYLIHTERDVRWQKDVASLKVAQALNTSLQSQLNQLQAAAPHALELQTTMSQIKTLANKF